MKYIKTTFDTGEIYLIPLIRIAEHRATYYKSKDDSNEQEEIDFVMKDSYEGIDWASNNMDWEDVVDFAIKIENGEREMDWCNAEKEIVEKEAENGNK